MVIGSDNYVKKGAATGRIIGPIFLVAVVESQTGNGSCKLMSLLPLFSVSNGCHQQWQPCVCRFAAKQKRLTD